MGHPFNNKCVLSCGRHLVGSVRIKQQAQLSGLNKNNWTNRLPCDSSMSIIMIVIDAMDI